MQYTQKVIERYIDMPVYWDIKEYLKDRRQAFAVWASSMEWDNEYGMYDIFREFEKANPRFPGRELRNNILAKYNHTCVQCGNTNQLCVDHIIPYSKGGLTVEENLTVLCRTCNLRKKDKI